MEIKYVKCLLDFVDQKWGMGESIDLYEGNHIIVNDAGDVHRFNITNEQLSQLEENPSVELALSFKL